MDTNQDPMQDPNQDQTQDPNMDPTGGQGGGQQITLSLSVDEATQLLQGLAVVGQQLDDQLKQLSGGANQPPGGAPDAGADDSGNGMTPDASDLQSSIMAKSKNGRM